MNTLISYILDDLRKGQPVALATILTRNGSTPRTAGAEMIVRPDGSIAGTIGGGRSEAETITLAAEVHQAKKSMVKEFHMTGKDAASSDMICGGSQRVLVEYLDPGNPHWIRQYELLEKAVAERKRAWVLIPLDGADRHAVFATGGQSEMTAVMNDPLEYSGNDVIRWNGKEIDLNHIHQPGVVVVDGAACFIQPVDPYGTMYLFGGGHVALQTAKVADLVGFRVVVIDDREEFITAERYPMASDRILVRDFGNCFDTLQMDANSYLVIVTRGHLADHVVLRQALKTDAVYIGMIGSKRKCLTIYKALLEEGFTQADIDRVHGPIGIEIDADSPEEIAVSIVGELIQIRSKWMN